MNDYRIDYIIDGKKAVDYVYGMKDEKEALTCWRKCHPNLTVVKVSKCIYT